MRPGDAVSGLGRLLLAAALALALPASAAETVICKDGTTDEGGRGACRGHGGVDKKATAAKKGGAAATAEKAVAEPKAEKKARKSKKEKAAEAATAEAAAPAEKQVAKKARKEKAAAAPGPTVTCKDGTTDEGGRGACRGHGGVDKKATAARAGGGTPAAAPAAAAPTIPAAAPAAPAPRPRKAEADGDKGPPTARCKDGNLSYAKHHTGACANHGGVAEWLDGTENKK